ncbi:UNVERIFIED_CONTAM: hypothetical protein GTU68_014549, partial [Idotea baltica]|nr:hypothetical protein [Idotea baltica]
PAIQPSAGPAPYVPQPKIVYNTVYVNTPDQSAGSDPIVIPPPQQRYIVYVMTKIGQQEQQVIQVPAGDNEEPGVFYVNYNEGDDFQLGDLSLQEVLAQQGQQGQEISSGGGRGGGGGGRGGGGGGRGGGGGGGGGYY